MSSCRLRYVAFVSLAAAGVLASSGDGFARDARRRAQIHVFQDQREVELAPLSRDDHDIIFEMEPLHPVKNHAAQPRKPAVTAPTQATKTAPAVKSPEAKTEAGAKPEPKTAPVAEKPAAVEALKAAEAPTAPTNREPPKQEAAKDSGHMALTPQKVDAQPQPAAAKAPDAAAMEAPSPKSEEASQPTPLPLNEALTPAGAAAPAAPQSAEQAPAAPPANDNPAPAETPKPAAAEQTTEAQPNAAAAPQAAAESPAIPSAEQPTQAEQGVAQPVAEPAKQAAETAPADASAEGGLAKRIAALLAQGKKGPAEIRIADRATLALPAGRVLIAGDAAKALAMEAGLELRPNTRALIAPEGEKLQWLAPIELLDDGYIKSEGALEADKLIAAFSAGLDEVNAQRAKSNQPAVALEGWLSPPAIDDQHRVTACVNVATKDGGDKYFNCEAWALGREGAIKISLAEGGEEGDKLKNEAKTLASSITFDQGKTYGEADIAADKIAPYAVADMLTSDVSAKSSAPAPAEDESGEGAGPVGLLVVVAKLWKVLLFAIAAIAGVIAWMRRRGTGKDVTAKASVRSSIEPTASPMAAPKANPTSLFAKLLPSLHAKFAKGPTNGAVAKAANSPSPVNSAAPVAESSSALQKITSRIRGAEAEAPIQSVDVSRALRARTLPGAAPEPAASPLTQKASAPATSREPETPPKVDAPREADAPIIARDMSEATIADSARALRETAAELARQAPREMAEPKDKISMEQEFGLVEPGDSEAVSAVMHARDSLRQAKG